MKYLLFLFSFVLLMSCGADPKPQDKEPVQAYTPRDYGTDLVFEKNGITVYEASVSNEYGDASLKLLSPIVPPKGPTQFEFEVQNYDLGAQTEDAGERNCANSGKGQHIHFILNNQPYKAHYESAFEEEVPEGTNVLLAFLSRSYHESIKTTAAHEVVKYGKGGQELDEPMLFYSRPKGSYAANDGNKLLLDFYLRNVSLGAEGNKVRATIDGEEFILPKWCPYFVEGLSVGDHTFRLELIDAQGNPIKNLMNEGGERVVGPYSDCGNRTITITAG